MEDSNNNLENNHQDKKKMIMAIVIGAVTLLIAITGATYAYFQVSTENNNTNSNVTVKTGKPGTATLKPGIGDLHIILNNVDMSESNSGNEYYADDEENYVDNETDGTHTISSVEITDGDTDISYKCTADVEVSLNTDAGSMGEALKAGDVLLNINGKEIDLYNVKTTNPTTVNLSFIMSGNSTKEIQAYAKLINKTEPQNYLTDEDGKQLEIKLTSKNLDCDMYEPDPKIAFLRSKDTNSTLSKDIVGDMYRYQAAFEDSDSSKMTNWICFGTTENCGTNDELIDKYMYRIIGITEDGEMKLIKETFIKEGSTSEFVWNDRYYIDPANAYYCPDGKCPDWPDSQLFKRLNGTSNGTQTGSGSTLDKEWTDIFVDSEKYDYLRSGDGKNGGTSASSWYNLISNHQWLYGDTNDSSALYKYNGDAMYAIESGAIDTTHYVGTKGNITSETYNWKDNPTLTAKIGLMYWYDYYYSYYDGVDESTRGNAGAYSKLTNAWLHFRRDGYNTSLSYEWLMSRWGVSSTSFAIVVALYVDDGDWNTSRLGFAYGVRPVFYLSSAAKILGDGTKTNPFILDVQE